MKWPSQTDLRRVSCVRSSLNWPWVSVSRQLVWAGGLVYWLPCVEPEDAIGSSPCAAGSTGLEHPPRHRSPRVVSSLVGLSHVCHGHILSSLGPASSGWLRSRNWPQAEKALSGGLVPVALLAANSVYLATVSARGWLAGPGVSYENYFYLCMFLMHLVQSWARCQPGPKS